MAETVTGTTVVVATKKRYIDAVKGFCIVLVVASHAGGIPIIGTALTACFMQVFFVLGGITYRDRSEETFGQFIVKKAKRLLVPYFSYATVLLAVDAIRNNCNISEIITGGGGILYARHCLLIYHGHENNIFLLDNLNGQLWFLPAMFLTYLLFWILVKSDKSKRGLLIVVYLFINIATSFLPVLLPWSLDTVFVTSILMYIGFCSKKYIKYVEELTIKTVFKPKTLTVLLCTVFTYMVAIKINGAINTSVRVFGDRGVLSIFLYIFIGCAGTFVYMAVFSVCEKTPVLKYFSSLFEYFGKHTIAILGTHTAIFALVEYVFYLVSVTNKYLLYIFKNIIALILGVIISITINKISGYFKGRHIKVRENV